jgi:uncharacterized protein YbjT (DUF2867 family)
MDQTKAPVVLVVDDVGLIGAALVKEIERDHSDMIIKVAAREQEQVAGFKAENRNAFLLDLDDPSSVQNAFSGVDRLFLVTGHTVAWLTAGKALVDAAKQAGITYIVHLGNFGGSDPSDPRFGWHKLIENYIKASGIDWTHLHPDALVESQPVLICKAMDTLSLFWGTEQPAWTASEKLATFAATILREGPEKHGGKDYWLSGSPSELVARHRRH